MKLYKLMGIGLLVSMNALASEPIETNLAPPSLVQDFYDYCSEVVPQDEDDTDSFKLKCVNEQLTDSSYDTFNSYKKLVDYMSEGDDNGNSN